MELQLNVGLLRKWLKDHPNEALTESIRYDSDSRITRQDINMFTEADIESLTKVLEANSETPGAEQALRKIATYRNLSLDPGGAKVRMVEALEQAFRLYLAKVPNHWVFIEEDDYLNPYYVDEIDYKPYDARSETPAHTTIRLQAISRGHSQHKSYSWEAANLRSKGCTVAELLVDRGIHIANEKLLADYATHMERYKALKPLTGHQFVGSGQVEKLSGRWGGGSTSLIRDGVPIKLVMDDASPDGEDDAESGAYGDDKAIVSDSYWRANKDDVDPVALPAHPYLRLFDLDSHDFLIAHVNQLKEYEWNPGLGDKLILPPEHKEVVTILMDTASEEIDDIIKGKSGGTIVICTGEPGTGKTLTAEVTSEVIKRPLYKVHCSQLGTDEEAIEKELSRVLNRATRWKALLLIDEADVYIRTRGTDIQQNAIVGVFLRILEYYRGVLFMTSNLGTIIDDAIMSRATVHLKYTAPCPSDLKKIWIVLSKQFRLDFPEPFVDSLVKTFPGISGRDVKALLKLVIRYSRKKDNKITLALFRLLAVHKDIKIATS